MLSKDGLITDALTFVVVAAQLEPGKALVFASKHDTAIYAAFRCGVRDPAINDNFGTTLDYYHCKLVDLDDVPAQARCMVCMRAVHAHRTGEIPRY